MKTSVTTTSTAGTRPMQRSSRVTGGVRTNVSRIASAIGTRTACAQYRTTTTSTQPANVTQGVRDRWWRPRTDQAMRSKTTILARRFGRAVRLASTHASEHCASVAITVVRLHQS